MEDKTVLHEEETQVEDYRPDVEVTGATFDVRVSANTLVQCDIPGLNGEYTAEAGLLNISKIIEGAANCNTLVAKSLEESVSAPVADKGLTPESNKADSEVEAGIAADDDPATNVVPMATTARRGGDGHWHYYVIGVALIVIAIGVATRRARAGKMES
jgi:hypothetical protein